MDVVSSHACINVHSKTFPVTKLYCRVSEKYIHGNCGNYTCSPILQNNTQKDFLELKPKMFFYQDHLPWLN